MSDCKITGACTSCNAMCFAVLETDENGAPKRLGPPKDNGLRIEFLLMDGTRMSLTFCTACAATITSDNYAAIWTKVMNSWIQELGNKPQPDWLTNQFSNGLLSEITRTSWKVVLSV